MKFCLLVLAVLFSVASNAQLKNIILEHNGTTSQYQNLDSAIAHAVSGDDLYLSGGSFPFSGTIQKGLNIYGAGFFPDSTLATLPTIITGGVVSISGVGANNTMLTGLLFTGPSVNVLGTSNVLISRCQFGIFTANNSSNLFLRECALGSISTGYSNTTVSNFEVTNSTIHGPVLSSNALFENNVFFNVGIGLFNYGGQGIGNSILRNNVIYLANPISYGFTNSYYNNVFTNTINSIPAGAVFQNNLQNHPLATIFENVVPSTVLLYTSNYHLKSGSPAIAAGIGGTDAGIYGGTNPAKNGFVPLNPHIQKFSVPANTDANGTLRINVSVRAQNN